MAQQLDPLQLRKISDLITKKDKIIAAQIPLSGEVHRLSYNLIAKRKALNEIKSDMLRHDTFVQYSEVAKSVLACTSPSGILFMTLKALVDDLRKKESYQSLNLDGTLEAASELIDSVKMNYNAAQCTTLTGIVKQSLGFGIDWLHIYSYEKFVKASKQYNRTSNQMQRLCDSMNDLDKRSDHFKKKAAASIVEIDREIDRLRFN